MRVHSSLQKYENEDIVMCNICFSHCIFLLLDSIRAWFNVLYSVPFTDFYPAFIGFLTGNHLKSL